MRPCRDASAVVQYRRNSSYAAIARSSRLIFLLVLVACAGEPGADDAVGRFLDAYNRSDVAAAMETTADDVVLERFDLLGSTAAVHEVLSWDSALTARLRVGPSAVFDDSVVFAPAWQTSSALQLLGLGEIEYETLVITHRAGLVTAMRFGTLQAESDRSLRQALEDFLPWAQHDYPQRLGRIRPNGRFSFQARHAADWLNLLREWRVGDRAPAATNPLR